MTRLSFFLLCCVAALAQTPAPKPATPDACEAVDGPHLCVMLDLVTKGTKPIYGSGLAAYAWDVAACSVGAVDLPWDKVRLAFPEIRIYPSAQTNAILAARTSRSLPVLIANGLGYSSAGLGIGITIDNTLRKSPSQAGPITTSVGLAVPFLTNTLMKSAPKYTIDNQPPSQIVLADKACGEWTILAARGNAPTTVGPRQVRP